MKVDAKLRTLSYTLEYDFSQAPERLGWHLVAGGPQGYAGVLPFQRSCESHLYSAVRPSPPREVSYE